MHIYLVLVIYFSLRKHDNGGFIGCILFYYLTVFNYIYVFNWTTMSKKNTKNVNNKQKLLKGHWFNINDDARSIKWCFDYS